MRSSGTSQDLKAVKLLNGSTAIAIGGNGIVLRTTDEGQNWTSQNPVTETDLMAVSFADDSYGVIGGLSGTILNTVDGGTSWNVVQTGWNSSYRAAFQINDQRAFVGGSSGISSFLVTRTSSNWGAFESFAFYLNGNEGRLVDLDYIIINDNADSLLFAVAQAWDGTAQVIISYDFGANWETLIDGPGILNAIDFVDNNIVYVVGDNGYIMRSNDSGSSWFDLSSGTTENLNDVSFTTPLIGTAVGNAGTIIRTTNGGANWITQDGGTRANLQAVSMADSDSAAIVGEMGIILYTTDGGNQTGGCFYIPGDINGNGISNGIDVTYGVSFFKGGRVPPIDCGAPVGSCPQPSPFFAAGDVNGNCAFNGIDITYFVGYLKGGPPLSYCPSCPPNPLDID